VPVRYLQTYTEKVYPIDSGARAGGLASRARRWPSRCADTFRSEGLSLVLFVIYGIVSTFLSDTPSRLPVAPAAKHVGVRVIRQAL